MQNPEPWPLLQQPQRMVRLQVTDSPFGRHRADWRAATEPGCNNLLCGCQSTAECRQHGKAAIKHRKTSASKLHKHLKAWCVPPAVLTARPCCSASSAVSRVPAFASNLAHTTWHIIPLRLDCSQPVRHRCHQGLSATSRSILGFISEELAAGGARMPADRCSQQQSGLVPQNTSCLSCRTPAISASVRSTSTGDHD